MNDEEAFAAMMAGMSTIRLEGSYTSAYDKTDMATISREELDAKLEAVEARIDARVARIEASVDSLVTEVRSVKSWVMASIVAVILTGFGASVAVILGVTANQYALGQLVTGAFQQGQQSRPGEIPPPPPGFKLDPPRK